jgi:hypothetical protein
MNLNDGFSPMPLPPPSPATTHLPSILEMIHRLDAAGYRVIPKANILRLGAELSVDTMYEALDPDVVIQLTKMLASTIGRELRTVLKLTRSENKDLFMTDTYRTVIEVIKP